MNPEVKRVVPYPQDALIKGVNTLADAVASTLGPMGNNVIIETPYGATTVTKDGVTVAKFIKLEDPVEDLGAQIIKQAAARTADLAGDGTTTATVIAQALVTNARRLILSGIPPIKVKREFENYLKQALRIISELSSPVEVGNIKEIATISANNDEEIGALIAEAFEHVGKDGIVVLDQSSTGSTFLQLSDGAQFQRGYISPFFITDLKKEECVLEDPFILITDKKLRFTQELMPILDKVAATGKPLLIIADEVDSQALQVLILNKMRGNISVCAVKAPSYGEHRLAELEDLAAITSANLIIESAANRLEDLKLSDLGRASKVIVGKTSTVIMEPQFDHDRVEKRIALINEQLKTETSEYLRQKLQKRISSINTKTAVLRVGAPTETEMKEIKDRIDDALKATSAAIAKGYLTGGGTALAYVAAKLQADNPPSLILPAFTDSLTAPLRTIASNAGVPPDMILLSVREANSPSYGYNALKGVFEDLAESGVIDPTLVVEQALKNAVSAASMIILSSTAIHFISREPRYSPGSLDDFQGV